MKTGRPRKSLILDPEQRSQLQAIANSRRMPAGLVQRVPICLTKFLFEIDYLDKKDLLEYLPTTLNISSNSSLAKVLLWMAFSIGTLRGEASMRTLRSTFTLGYLASCIFLFAGCQPSIDDKDPARRCAAVASVRDDSMLAKIVLGDESSSVRQAALARIKDQQILIMIALRSKDWDIRGRAATEIFVRTGDRTILAKEAIKVAVEDRDSEARLYAISFVDDQAALTKLAFSNTDLNVRVAALQHLDFKHRASMRRIAMQDCDWRFRLAVFKSEDDRFNKVILLNRLLDSDSVLANIAGHRDAIQCIADMKTITQHPTIRSRFPHLRCVASATKVSQNYGQIGSSPKSWETLNGERITVQYEQNGYILSAASWESRFPYMNDHPGDIKAEVVEGDLLRRFFHLRAFTSRDLAELAHADNVEVQMAAVRNINDRAFIAKFAIEEKDPDVREAAERRANELRRTR